MDQEQYFAIKVGKLWATKNYNVFLDDKPTSIYSIEDAKEIAEITGGTPYLCRFTPCEFTAGVSEEEENE